MFQTTTKSNRMPGYSQVELIIGFSLVALLMLGLLVIVNPFEDDDYGKDVPAYRAANAMYIFNAISRQQVALLSYKDMYGDLPGDSTVPVEIDGQMVVGNANGKIESANGEKSKVFRELFLAGIGAQEIIRIRGKNLELSWVVLRDGDRTLGTGHFFKLSGIHPLEARAYDYKYDDGVSGEGDVLYATNENDGVDLYIKFNLYR